MMQPQDSDTAEARLAELVRQGNAVLPQIVGAGPPPRIPVMTLREILDDLDESRADR